MHRDTVIGIVGVVILVAAMVGVFTYERNQAVGADGDGLGATQNLTGPGATGNVAVQSTTDSTVTFNQTGMTNVTFTLRWTPGAGVDTLKLTVAPSAGTQMTTGATSEEENDGEITLSVPVPNTAADGTIGVGDWQVTVEFVRAEATTPIGPPPVQPPILPPGSTDSAVDFTVDSSVQAYSTGA